jgi:hypothetical protein
VLFGISFMSTIDSSEKGSWGRSPAQFYPSFTKMDYQRFKLQCASARGFCAREYGRIVKSGHPQFDCFVQRFRPRSVIEGGFSAREYGRVGKSSHPQFDSFAQRFRTICAIECGLGANENGRVGDPQFDCFAQRFRPHRAIDRRRSPEKPRLPTLNLFTPTSPC